MISNLYKIRWGEEESKYKKEEMLRKFNGQVKSSREIKRQRGKGKVGGKEEEFFFFFSFFFLRIGR